MSKISSVGHYLGRMIGKPLQIFFDDLLKGTLWNGSTHSILLRLVTLTELKLNFLQRYGDRMGPNYSITFLWSKRMKVEEDFVKYVDRWRAMAERLTDSVSEADQVKMS